MKHLIFLCTFSLVLTACGGGGGGDGGPTLGGGGVEIIAPPLDLAVDDTNVTQIVDSSVEITDIVLEEYDETNEDVVNALPFGVSVHEDPSMVGHAAKAVADVTADFDTLLPLVPVGAIVTDVENGNCGGNFTVTYDDNPNVSNFVADADFNSWCNEFFGVQIIYNGAIDYSGVVSGDMIVSFTMVYNLEITTIYEGVTETLNESGTISCVGENYEEDSCTYTKTSASYTSNTSDDTYTVYHADISGDETDGYDYSATITSDIYGTYEIVGTNLVPDGFGSFSSGTIELIDSSGEVVVLVDFSNGSYAITTYYEDADTDTADDPAPIVDS